MANEYLKPQIPLKDLNSENYFYPLTTLDQIIIGNSRLSAYFSENDGKLIFNNIDEDSVGGNVKLDGIIANRTLFVENDSLLSSENIFINNDSLAINKTSITSGYNFEVNGKSLFNNSVIIAATTDISGTAANAAPLIIGNQTGQHLEFDGNEIISKSNGTTVAKLNIQTDGGYTQIGKDGLGINGSDTSYKLYVNGTSYFNGDTTHNGILYFANGTKYFINNSAKGYLFDLFVNKVRLYDNWIGFYSGANSTTTRYGYIQADGFWLNICKENGGNILFSGSNVYIRGGKSLYVGDDSTGGMIQCGTYKDTANGEHQVRVASGAGIMYMYSTAAANGNRGIYGINNAGTNHSVFYLGQDNYVHAGTRWYGAVWNDYAEFRKGQMNSLKPGQVVTENGNGTMKLANQRLQKGCKILSDTYGYALGETTECKLPIAVSGRVLVYCDTPNEELEPGDCLCANYTGNAIKMTQEEIIKYPDRIIGTVSEFPDYEVWHAGDQTDPNGMKEEVKVNGRIWVYVR